MQESQRHGISRREGIKISSALAAATLGGQYVVWPALAQKAIGETADDATPVDGGEVIIGISELPDTLDPQKTGAAITATIMRNAGDTLIAKNFNGEYVPSIASDWTVSEDGLTWSFTIREGVVFHDGTTLDAIAVKASFDRILDPATNAVSAGTNVGPMLSTSAPDSTTFEFVLSEPFAPLLENLTHPTLSIINTAAAEAMGSDFGRTPVLSGPWKVEEWRTGDRIVLKRHEAYAWAPEHLHQGGPAHIETLTFQSIIEEASRSVAFEAGEVHQLTLAPYDIEWIVEADQHWTVSYLRPGVTWFGMNVTKAPFDDVRVRRAMYHAINKTDVMNAAIEEYGQPVYGYLSPVMLGYWEGISEYAPAFDVEQAKALLSEAGWADSDGDGILEKDGNRLEFTTLIIPTDAHARASVVIQSQLKAIGVHMEIQTLEFSTLLNQAGSGEYQSMLMGYTSLEPNIAYQWFHSSQVGAGNLSFIEDPTLDELIMEGRSTMDIDERIEVYAELERAVVDLVPWVPLYVDEYTVGFNKMLHNATFHDDGYAVYFDAWVEN